MCIQYSVSVLKDLCVCVCVCVCWVGGGVCVGGGGVVGGGVCVGERGWGWEGGNQ